jgi:cytoskeletal protein CcmA (bactofilin family)
VGVFSKSESDDKGLSAGRGDVKPDAKPAFGKTAPEAISTLGHGVLVTGNIVSESTLRICGRVNGDIHASHLVIQEGAQIEGNVVAQETVILGVCKGIIRGNNVKLQGMAVVEGEIYSKSLTIEQDGCSSHDASQDPAGAGNDRSGSGRRGGREDRRLNE